MYTTQKRLQRILRTKGVQGLATPCFHYFNRNKRHFFGGLVVMCIFALVIPSTIITTSKKFSEVLTNEELKDYKEFHDMIESGQGLAEESSTPYGSCSIHSPSHPKSRMNPSLVATFPGSSSDLMRLLVETTTGVWTSARIFRDDVVAIKTHYPYYDNHIDIDSLEESLRGASPKALLVMRDPMHTLKVFHSFVQMTSNDDEKYSWEDWREAHFDGQLKHWDDFMRYWLSSKNLDPASRHVVIHERLIDEKEGAAEVREFVEFITSVTKLPNKVPWDDLPCLWSRVVTFQVQAEPKIKRRRLRELVTDTDEDIPVDPEDIPYTYVQLDKIAGKLTQLIDEFDVDEKVLHSLLSYRIAALENMQRLLGEDPVLVSNSHGTCMVTTPKYEVMTPMFQVSYPGSGSEMLRDLIEAMTGVKTAETKRRNDVVAIKTMYPDRKFDIHPSLLNRDMKKMILLLRCPLHAIASKFNHIYWRKNDLEPHSVQPPLELWESWRDKNYETELKGWVDHLKYWINNIKGSNQIIISYESLTNEATGPQDALRLSMFIRTIFNEGVINPAPAFTISCLWFRAVRIFDQAHSDKSQDSSNHPLFTTLQLETTATELTNMLLKFNSERTLTPILQKYWEHTVNQIK